jgi:hypothetical protein
MATSGCRWGIYDSSRQPRHGCLDRPRDCRHPIDAVTLSCRFPYDSQVLFVNQEKAHRLPANPSDAWILKKVHFSTCSHHEGRDFAKGRRVEN